MANASEFRELKDEEIARRIGELQNSGELAGNRKDLARLLTVQRERALKAKAEGKK